MIWTRNATAAPFYSVENQARLLIANERMKKRRDTALITVTSKTNMYHSLLIASPYDIPLPVPPVLNGK